MVVRVFWEASMGMMSRIWFGHVKMGAFVFTAGVRV